MKKQKDLSELIQNRLKDASEPPSEGLWNRIDTTLTKQQERRRGLAWLFGSIGFLVLVLIGFFTMTHPSISSEAQRPDVDTEKAASESEILTNHNTSPLPEHAMEKRTESLQTTHNTTEDSKPALYQKTLHRTGNDSGFKKQTTYYYYNSKDSTQVITTSKKVADSLLQRVEKRTDSIYH